MGREVGVRYIAQSQPRLCPPEYRLLAAVMADAVRCACRTKTQRIFSMAQSGKERRSKRAKEATEAREWLLDSPLDSSAPFSFAWVCEYLNCDPARVRENARRALEDPTFLVEEMRSADPAASFIPSALYEAA